ILKGDVKGAYRHLMSIASQVFRMAALVTDLKILLIDLAAPFGWSGSPPFDGLFGRAIRRYRTLFWLRMAVLGPRSINEAKFSNWSTELVALGLLWNTEKRTVSMPADKIAKALQRVNTMIQHQAATTSDLQKLLGSLRHVSTCLRAAKPFYQQLQALAVAAPRFAKVKLSAGAKADLRWFQNILGHGNFAALPLSMFGDLPSSDVELYMDASNMGLAILDPGANKFIQEKFDETETLLIANDDTHFNSFSINVREHLCIALALWTWGSSWSSNSSGQMLHVKCWSDNISAVQWSNRLSSKNELSQEINRAIGLAEAYFNLRVSVEHLPGSTNTTAASRAWTDPYKTVWTNFSVSWEQTAEPPIFRKLYTNFSKDFNPAHWPRHQTLNTQLLGHSGCDGARKCDCLNRYPRTKSAIHISSHFS
ncbi:hypothetical protein PHYSODRAFT_510996, partial [Phytophthora sojae]